VSPDEAYNALKGLRSAAARLAMHTAHAGEVVAWLKQQPQVKRILYPPLPEDPGHALWRRDFKGANGLLSIEFAPPIAPAAADRFVDSLRLFGIGASWGGHERLALTYPVIPGWHGGAAAHRLGGPSRSHRRPGAGFPRRLGLAARSPCQP
jgi:cystathionine beta-lyase/cystathionine gamma-synthase